MGIVILNEKNAEDILGENAIVVAYFGAKWCAPCRNFNTVFKAVAMANPDIVFCKADVDADKGLAESFNVNSVPFLIIFKHDTIIYAESGAITQLQLEDLILETKEITKDNLSNR